MYLAVQMRGVEIMYDRILTPTDGSEPAEAAAEDAIELAREFGASLHVVHVVEPIPLGGLSAGGEPASAEHSEVVEEQRAEGERTLERIRNLAAEAGVDVMTAIVYGKPSTEILEYVDDENIEVVVMGTRGRSGAERFVLGSVAERVVRRSPVPVITVRSA